MKALAIIIAVFLAVGIAGVMRSYRLPPETMLYAARHHNGMWIPWRGTILDAQAEGFKWAALVTGEIILVDKRKKTGRKLMNFPQRSVNR